MAKKYQVTIGYTSNDMISIVDVEKESDKSVWIMGSRLAKRSDWKNFFDDLDEAKQCLRDYHKSEMDKAERSAHNQRKKYEDIELYIGNYNG